MRTDTQDENEKVLNITINGEDFGSCNPDGIDCNCTFYDCSQDHWGDHLTKQEVRAMDGKINVRIIYSADVDYRPCCFLDDTLVTAGARVSLTPPDGIIY